MADEVGAHLVREECLQCWRSAHRDQRLRHAVIRGAEQHDFAVAPRLFGSPGDHRLVVIDICCAPEHPLLPCRATHPTALDDHGTIAAVGEDRRRTDLIRTTGHSRGVGFGAIPTKGHHSRVTSRRSRSVDIRVQHGAVRHRNSPAGKYMVTQAVHGERLRLPARVLKAAGGALERNAGVFGHGSILFVAEPATRSPNDSRYRPGLPPPLRRARRRERTLGAPGRRTMPGPGPRRPAAYPRGRHALRRHETAGQCRGRCPPRPR